MRLRDTDRIEPKLCDIITMLNMDVRRLRSFETVEEKAKTRSPQDGWYRSFSIAPYDYAKPGSTVPHGLSWTSQQKGKRRYRLKLSAALRDDHATTAGRHTSRRPHNLGSSEGRPNSIRPAFTA